MMPWAICRLPRLRFGATTTGLRSLRSLSRSDTMQQETTLTFTRSRRWAVLSTAPFDFGAPDGR